MAEGVRDRALKHAADRMGANGLVFMLQHRAVLGSACDESLPLNGDRVLYKNFDPHGGEASGIRTASAVLR